MKLSKEPPNISLKHPRNKGEIQYSPEGNVGVMSLGWNMSIFCFGGRLETIHGLTQDLLLVLC